MGGEPDVEFMRALETVSEVASLDQRWTSSWATSFKARYAHLDFFHFHLFLIDFLASLLFDSSRYAVFMS